MRSRIARSASKTAYVRQFIELPQGKRIFQEIWEVQLFAAALGFAAKRRIPMVDVNGKPDADSGSAVDFGSFNASGAWPGFIHSLALVDSGDPDILNSGDGKESSHEKRLVTFEEYANAGFEIMQNEGVLEMDAIMLAEFLAKHIPPPPAKSVPKVKL